VVVCVLVDTWVLVLVFITWCSALSLTRQYPCHYYLSSLQDFILASCARKEI
jgi:hypothetical protein